MGHNFLEGDLVCFVQEVDRQDPYELPNYLPPIPQGTVGRIMEMHENGVTVRIAHPRNPRQSALLRLYAEDGTMPHCPITAIERMHDMRRKERLPQTIADFSGDPDDVLNLTPEERVLIKEFWSAST